LISYELILSSIILLVIVLTGNLNLTVNVESQKVVYFVLPLLPIFIMFFIGCIAETNRPPFDLAEAESELVSGFMTEHSAVIFVFFFLAEYASIVLICIFTTILFLGGYLGMFSFSYIINILYFFNIEWSNLFIETKINFLTVLLQGLMFSLMLGIKSCALIFTFIWVRASFPRIRFDQLMSYCWTVLLPIIIAFIIVIPCVVYSLSLIPVNFNLL